MERDRAAMRLEARQEGFVPRFAGHPTQDGMALRVASDDFQMSASSYHQQPRK
jgi:hypothetical protein